MSYILDALKKAERERGTARVPTLTAVDDARGSGRNRLVAVVGGLLLCAVVFLLFFQTTHFRQPRPAGVGTEKSGNPSGTDSQAAASVPQDAQAPPVVKSGSRSSAASRTETSKPPANATVRNAAEGERRPNPVAQDESSPQPSVVELATVPPAERASPQPVVNTGTPATKEVEPVSLEEAVAKMTLNILVFYEAEADRRVIINGRRYVKGDLVDGKYLIESITQEGATLSFEGARALLRPGR